MALGCCVMFLIVLKDGIAFTFTVKQSKKKWLHRISGVLYVGMVDRGMGWQERVANQ